MATFAMACDNTFFFSKLVFTPRTHYVGAMRATAKIAVVAIVAVAHSGLYKKLINDHKILHYN